MDVSKAVIDDIKSKILFKFLVKIVFWTKKDDNKVSYLVYKTQ